MLVKDEQLVDGNQELIYLPVRERQLEARNPELIHLFLYGRITQIYDTEANAYTILRRATREMKHVLARDEQHGDGNPELIHMPFWDEHPEFLFPFLFKGKCDSSPLKNNASLS
jgi:hypothetical protein